MHNQERLFKASFCFQDCHVHSIVDVVAVIMFRSTAKHVNVPYTALTQKEENRPKWDLSFWSQGKGSPLKQIPQQLWLSVGARERVLEKAHQFLGHALQHKHALQYKRNTHSVGMLCNCDSFFHESLCGRKALQKKYPCAFATSTLPISDLPKLLCLRKGTSTQKHRLRKSFSYLNLRAPTARAQ